MVGLVAGIEGAISITLNRTLTLDGGRKQPPDKSFANS